MKRGWYKNQSTGEVVFAYGSNDNSIFYRVRSGETKYERKPDFFRFHLAIRASGFPPLKPKDFKPRYAVLDTWHTEAYVEEFAPGRFKIVCKDGEETIEPLTWKTFAKFFDDGTYKLVSEAEAKVRLDKPKTAVFEYLSGETYRRVTDGVWFHPERCPDGYVRWYNGIPVDTIEKLVHDGTLVPASQFVPHWAKKPEPEKPSFDITKTYESIYGGYYLAPNSHGDAFGIYRSTDHEYLATWNTDAVRKEYNLGMLRMKAPQKLHPHQQAVVDAAKTQARKKVLVEWAVLQSPAGTYRTELWPESITPLTGKFKTGRTVEVPE